jgi:hypothetical protein
MTADQINTAINRADIDAANKPADIKVLRTELESAKVRLAAGFAADNAAIASEEDAFAGFELSEEAWLSMMASKISAYERAIESHPDA